MYRVEWYDKKDEKHTMNFDKWINAKVFIDEIHQISVGKITVDYIPEGKGFSTKAYSLAYKE